MTRRDFILQSIFSAFAVSASSAFGMNSLVRRTEVGGKIYFGDAFSLFCYSPSTDQVQSMDCPIKSHSFLPLPSSPDQILSFEKWGKGMVRADFRNRKIVRRTSADTGMYFYGHAVFSQRGDSFYAIQVDHRNGQSYLTEMETDSFRILEQVPLTLGGAHELAFLPQSSILVIACTGWKPILNSHPLAFERIGNSKLLFFDTALKKTVGEQELDDPYLSLAHLKVASDGSVFTISDIMSPVFADRFHGRLYRAGLYEKIRPLDFPKGANPRGELLSLEINEKRGVVAATNPVGGNTYLFSMESGKGFAEIATDSKSVSWSADGSRLFSMAPVKNKVSPVPHLNFEFQMVPNGGLGLSSHMLFVPERI